MPPTEQDRALAAKLAAEVYDRWARENPQWASPWCDQSGTYTGRPIDCVLAGLAASREREREAARKAWQYGFATGTDEFGHTGRGLRDRYLAETYPPVVPPVVLCAACLQVGADPVTGQHATWGTCIAALGVALAASRTEGK